MTQQFKHVDVSVSVVDRGKLKLERKPRLFRKYVLVLLVLFLVTSIVRYCVGRVGFRFWRLNRVGLYFFTLLGLFYRVHNIPWDRGKRRRRFRRSIDSISVTPLFRSLPFFDPKKIPNNSFAFVQFVQSNTYFRINRPFGCYWQTLCLPQFRCVVCLLFGINSSQIIRDSFGSSSHSMVPSMVLLCSGTCPSFFLDTNHYSTARAFESHKRNGSFAFDDWRPSLEWVNF